MVCCSFDFIKKCMLFLFLIFGWGLQAQPTLSLDWMNLEPEGYAIKIKKDSKGNAVVLARGDGNPYFHIITLKYDKAGALIWKRIYVDPLNSFPDFPEDVEVDNLDNIYVTGTVNYDGNGVVLNSRSILLKYDSLGNLVWKREFGGNVNSLIEAGAWSLKIFDDKFIYVAGHVDSSNGNGFWKSFLAQYDSSGFLNWSYIDTNNYETFASRILVDKLGNAYLCGNTVCCLPGYNMFATKFDSAGNIKWKTVIDEPFYSYCYVKTAILDDSCNIFLAGQTYDTLSGTGYDCYLVKLDSSGSIQWASSFYEDSTSSGVDGINNIVLDNYQDCYLLGYSGVGSIANKGFIVKFSNQTGEKKWKIIKNNWGFTNGIASNDSLIVLTGIDSLRNLILSAYDISGLLKWHYDSFCQCGATDLFQSDSSFVLAGANFEPFTVNQDSIMTCRINLDYSNFIKKDREHNIPIFATPNPFSEELTIRLSFTSPIFTIIRVYNPQGDLVFVNDFKHSIKLNTSDWSSGMYFLEIKNTYFTLRQKIIKIK